MVFMLKTPLLCILMISDFKKFKTFDKEAFHKYINEVKTSPVKVTRKELEEIFNPEVFKEVVNKVIEKLKARP